MRRAYKRARGFGHGIVQLWHREVGDVSPRSFAHRMAASEDLVLRFGIHKKLEKHGGCVNTVSFNADGDILVSGSDDRMVILWNWDAGLVKLSFHSGHSNNVFQAKFMPYVEDRIIVTCAADGEVRHAEIREGGKVLTSLLAQHEGRAHKLAIEPGSPYIFYTCGEDGLVQHFDLRTKSATKLFTCKSFPDRSEFQQSVQLNAIAIDQRNPNFFAIAGTDEYARVYDIRKYKRDGSTDCDYPTNCFCPPHLIGNGHVGITGLAFSDQSELLTSYNDELIYLFTKDQGLGPNPVPKSPKRAAKDTETGDGSKSFSSSSPADANPSEPQVYKGHRNCETVKGVSFFGPNCEYVTSGSDCGRIFIWRKRDGELLRVMEGDKYVVNCIEPHPYATVIASSGIENDVKIWTPNALEPAPPVNMDEVLMAVQFDCFTLADYDYYYGDDYDIDGDDDFYIDGDYDDDVGPVCYDDDDLDDHDDGIIGGVCDDGFDDTAPAILPVKAAQEKKQTLPVLISRRHDSAGVGTAETPIKLGTPW